MYGPKRLTRDLEELGYVVEEKDVQKLKFVVIPEYEVEVGRFRGKIIDLAIQATNDFPRTTASSIHVKARPQLLEKSDSRQNIRNIIDSPLGAEWLYWSHNFNWSEEKTTRRLMNQIKGILANA